MKTKRNWKQKKAMTDKVKIMAEIERLLDLFPKPHGEVLPIDQNAYNLISDLKRFIESLPDEQQPSGDLEKAAKEYVKENCILPEDCNDGDNPYYEECTATIFKDGANWQKNQTINKACEWLRYCIDVDDEVKMIDGEPEAESFIQKNIHRIKVANQLVEDFKKAMEQ